MIETLTGGIMSCTRSELVQYLIAFKDGLFGHRHDRIEEGELPVGFGIHEILVVLEVND